MKATLMSNSGTTIERPRSAHILVVDNYDSFVFTIVGYLQQLGAECEVARNDAVSPGDGAGFDGVLVSPGP
ncbi:MAG TPA: aminodeoxychorismate/anthranilate synthase component II, partial [Dermatophilaceae bacterium]